MFKSSTILILCLASFYMLSQEDKKIGIIIESQFMNINSNLNFNRIGLNVTIAGDYRLHPKLYAGAFVTQMIDISARHNANYLINNKIIDVSSSLFSSYGIYGGYELYKVDRITIIPELRLGYGSFEAKSALPNANSTDDLSARMITFTPRALASYKISKGISTGISIGYMFLSYIGDTKLLEYNMQNISGGIFLKFHTQRCR
jgi:hypothetical protein